MSENQTKDGDPYVTDREILNVFSFEIRKLDEDIWPLGASPPRSQVMAHFDRLKHELLKISRIPRRVFIDNSNRPSGEEGLHDEPTDWQTTAEADFERNKQRHYEKVRSNRGHPMGLGRGGGE
jgi:hypothetical protein